MIFALLFKNMKVKISRKFVMGCKARFSEDNFTAEGLPKTITVYNTLNEMLGLGECCPKGTGVRGYFPYMYEHTRNDKMRRVAYMHLSPMIRERLAGQCAKLREGRKMMNYIDKAKESELAPTTKGSYRYDTAIGVELETFGTISRDNLTSVLPFWARAKNDGSIRPADGTDHEVILLMPRSELEPRLFKVCRLLRSTGLQTNRSCGLHVHIDFRRYSEKECIAQARIMNAWLEAMQELVPLSRRENTYCQFGISQTSRYRAVNVLSYQAHKTLEIRLHSATLDYTKILAWIRLLELLRVIRKKPKAGGCISTLEQLPLATHDLIYWKMRHQQCNPAQYTQTLSAEQE
jgi:hypothetical protein